MTTKPNTSIESVVEEARNLKVDINDKNGLVITRDWLTTTLKADRERGVEIVRRMTEIPVGARNPTRDATVILGENIIEALNNQDKV